MCARIERGRRCQSVRYREWTARCWLFFFPLGLQCSQCRPGEGGGRITVLIFIARSLLGKALVVQDLMIVEDADLVYSMETWLRNDMEACLTHFYSSLSSDTNGAVNTFDHCLGLIMGWLG